MNPKKIWACVAQPRSYSVSPLCLACFAIAGIWAGSITAFLAVENTVLWDTQTVQSTHTAEYLTTQEAQILRRYRKQRDQRDNTPRTEPYNEENAPEFEFPEPIVEQPIVESPTTPAPVVESPPVTEEPAPTEEVPTEEEPDPVGKIQAVIAAITNLINGQGGTSDIITLIVTALSIFGGAKLGSSDALFKLILTLFSKKSSFHDVLEERLIKGGRVLARRRGSKSKPKSS